MRVQSFTLHLPQALPIASNSDLSEVTLTWEGGYGTGDLSDAALMWIIKQAQLQGIQVYTARIKKFEWDIVTNPILHDKSGNRDMPYNSPMIADRAFIYEGGQRIKQARANIGGTTTDWARTFVSYYIFACGPGHSPAVGQVDMKKYSEWLGSQGVQIGFQVPKTSKVCN